mmetsp:Transcript_48209/g.89371  ORF Transcript_48209/g.89371 Transcript_48209/m.89371 type:complete len:302 (-) Transcript_48209:1270-2175(-)
MDPDELYTCRSQYWLGHYDLCLEEAKSVARRPMSAQLKAEREEFVLRAHLAKGQLDKVIKDSSSSSAPGVKALGLRATYESSSEDEAARESVIESLKTMLADAESSSSSLQLTAAHVFLQHGMTREALQCVHLGTTMEHIALSLQIYLRIDRIDLARQQLDLLKQADEDAVLTQLSSVYVDVANGRSTAPDSVHTLGSLTEQYGPSLMLLNCMAVAQMTAGNFKAAEAVLTEASQEGGNDADTLINTVVCYQHMGKDAASMEPLLAKLRSGHPSHPFVQGLVRVEGAFEREALKYKVESVA